MKPINPLSPIQPIEARWLDTSESEAKALACPTCGHTVAIVSNSESHIYKPGQKEPEVKKARQADLEPGAVPTTKGVYKFPPEKKRYHKQIAQISLKAKDLPAVADCPNPKCKRQIILRLHPLKI
jgi:hypothetical protein